MSAPYEYRGKDTDEEEPVELDVITKRNHADLLTEVEMLFRRLEPNLIVSYDMPDGLGMVMRLGRVQDMQRRLSRVPGEEISTASSGPSYG